MREFSLKENHGGSDDTGPPNRRIFLKTPIKLRNHINHLSGPGWTHCFPGNEGLLLSDFFKGLEWFLSQPECLECNEGESDSWEKF
jgi:hypothetical protein